MDAVAMLATAVVASHSISSLIHRPSWPPQPSERSTQVQQLTFSMLSESFDTARDCYESKAYTPATHSFSVGPPIARSRIQEASQ